MRVEQRRLAGARRRDDQRALAVADRRDQIDRAARELGSALGRPSRLHEQLPFSGYDAGRELKSGRFVRERGIALVDRSNLDDRRASALIEADRRVDRDRRVRSANCRTMCGGT